LKEDEKPLHVRWTFVAPNSNLSSTWIRELNFGGLNLDTFYAVQIITAADTLRILEATDATNLPSHTLLSKFPMKKNFGIIRVDYQLSGDLTKEQELAFQGVTELISGVIDRSPAWGLLSAANPIPDLNVEHTVELFLDRFEQMRMKPEEDLWFSQGRELFANKVRNLVQTGRPIAMVLPSFPFKSHNTKKAISIRADMAEKLAFQNIEKFCDDVKKFYPPGVCFVIVSDGRVYSSQFEIPLEDVLSFQQELTALKVSPHLHIIGLEEFLPVTIPANKRQTLMAVYGVSAEKVDHRIMNDKNFNRVYCGFKHFMMEELHFPPNATWKLRKRKVKASAREMMRSNDAYGRLVECLFPNHMRLSIHPHSNVEKVGIILAPVIKGADFKWGTPWHNCAVLRKSGDWELLRRKIAIERGYLLHDDVPLPYYEEK